RDLASYLEEAQARIDKEVKFDPQKHRLEWAGQFENQRRAQERLTVILGVVLLAMGTVLFLQFGKMRQTLLILGVVPLATLGGLIAIH
ncbi:efflux RND transporter permease subunit, partial [Escherichia coli]